MISLIHNKPFRITSIRKDNITTKNHDTNGNSGVLKLCRKVTHERDDIYTVAPVVSSSNIPRKKQRQSFSMKTKLSWVKDYQSKPAGTNMRSWLDRKNIDENTKVSYTSFRRWNSTLQHMTNRDIISCSSPYLKKNFISPHDEMEKVLIEFLKIRNHRLRSTGRRKSTPSYIKAKAIEFYGELYGDDSTHKFKASNGWLSRFQDAYRHLLDPDLLKQKETNGEDENYLKYQDRNASSTVSPSIIEGDLSDSVFYQEKNLPIFQEQKISLGDITPFTEPSSLDLYLDQPLTEREMEFMRQGISF